MNANKEELMLVCVATAMYIARVLGTGLPMTPGECAREARQLVRAVRIQKVQKEVP
jgi:hypothetical protein